VNRRSLALGALVAFLALLTLRAAPAANAAIAVGPTGPAEGAEWTGNATDFHVFGTATTDNSNGCCYITGINVTADSSDGANHHYPKDGQPPASATYTDKKTSQSYDFPLFPDINGAYAVKIVVNGQKGCDNIFFGCQPDTAAAARAITVAVPPKAPTGVKATLSGSVVSVSWDANPEPDMLGYLVGRQVDNGDFRCIAEVDQSDQPSYKVPDDLKDKAPGGYRWRVTAFRAKDMTSTKPSCSDGGTGIPSQSSLTTGVGWKTTTSTTKGDGGGGGTTDTTKPPAGSGLTHYSGNSGTTDTSSKTKKPNLSALSGLSPVNNLARVPSGRGAGEADSGFNELLPFAPGSGGDDPGAISGADSKLGSAGGDNGNTTKLLFVAAGLLVAVLSAHVLWLKAQVDRMPLEALPPELPLV
jgi:hypothetical protein